MEQQLELDGASYTICLPDAETDYIQGKIAKDKLPYELEMLRDMASRIQPGDLVLDVGANIGNHTLYLVSVSGCHVHAFEPNEHLCDALAQSVGLNCYQDKVTIHRLGVAANKGVARFSKLVSANLGGQSLEVLQAGDDVSIPLIALDDLDWPSKISLIKIDVEGMESEVLQGGEQLIRRDKPVLYIEAQTADDFRRLDICLRELGYLYCATFNATPTHVFLHETKISLSDDLPRLLTEKALQLYEFKRKEQVLCGKLHDCSRKYRDASERILQLSEASAQSTTKCKQLQTALNEHDAMLSACKDQLNSANEKYRHVTGQTIPRLKQKLEELNAELNKIRAEKIAAQRALALIRSSSIYRAGLHLGAAGGSFTDALKLPIRLWRLRKQALLNATKSEKVNSSTTILTEASQIDHLRLNTAELVGKPARQVRMACVMDDFTFGSYEHECELLQLTPHDWLNELESFQPEVLFIESAWRGKDELWGSKIGHCRQDLQGIVAWCRARHVPTLFWNKEDPVHFETFLTTAKLFDFVFTTDLDCVHRYKLALKHPNVYFLPFACQPLIHNPIEKYMRKDAFCFAGAYYLRYPERTRDLESFVKELPAYRPIEIYDRNYGKDDLNYCFPEQYQPYIVGTLPFSEIDRAYKGYRYAINLNSIKQSQTMFARRVYELLASNTLTISNYSRGVRLMFGDLVVASDSGAEVLERLQQLDANADIDKLKLAGLRKVMSEHTYADRLNYILEKISGQPRARELPGFTVIAKVANQEEATAIINAVARQKSVQVQLLLVCDDLFPVVAGTKLIGDAQLAGRALHVDVLKKQHLQEFMPADDWVAGMLPSDFYGSHYLLDMALATRYSRAQIVGKAAYFALSACKDAARLHNADQAYRCGAQLAARRAIIHPELAAKLDFGEWLFNLETWVYGAPEQLAVDCYNYCQDAGSNPESSVVAQVSDLGANVGVSLAELVRVAESVSPMQNELEHAAWLDGAELANLLNGKAFTWLKGGGAQPTLQEHSPRVVLSRGQVIKCSLSGLLLEIDSKLPDGKHDYIYGRNDLELQSLLAQLSKPAGETMDGIPLHLQIDPGLNLSLVVLYLDVDKQRLGHEVLQANRNVVIRPIAGARYLRFGLRVYSGGNTKIYRLVLGHLDLEPPDVLGRSELLLLTNHYPSYDDLYRNAFVHSRVKAYRGQGVMVDVFRLRSDQPITWHEFQNVDVITGSQGALRRMLASGRYQHVLVHFLCPEMWEVLKEFIDTINVTVWVHGAEIQPWYRRKFNLETPEQEMSAMQISEKRMQFWRTVLDPFPGNLHMVFVSNYFAEEVMEDLGFRLRRQDYSVIHNPVDTNLFRYSEKDPEQRKKILSVRPYSSRVYANDLMVGCIEKLSEMPFFKELEFRIVGDGVLFDAVVDPLRKFENVVIEKGFLTQSQIAQLHKEYGVFLCPSRYDTQGVSRDEARASGLVAVVTNVAAVPEFVDEGCAILVSPEDPDQLAQAIAALQNDVHRFKQLSQSAAMRVAKQTSADVVVQQELACINVKLRRR